MRWKVTGVEVHFGNYFSICKQYCVTDIHHYTNVLMTNWRTNLLWKDTTLIFLVGVLFFVFFYFIFLRINLTNPKELWILQDLEILRVLAKPRDIIRYLQTSPVSRSNQSNGKTSVWVSRVALNRVVSLLVSQQKENAAKMDLSPLRRMEFNDHEGGSNRANLDQPGCWHCSRYNRVSSPLSKYSVPLSGVLQTRVDLLQ